MKNHCETEPRQGLDTYEFTPLVAEIGSEVVVKLEAAAHPWDAGGGVEPLEGWSHNGTGAWS